MRLQTNLVRKDSRFYFRSRIPKDLKSHYGKTELFVSLKTSDKRVADYELAKFKVNLYAEFARLRGEVFGFEVKPDIDIKSSDTQPAEHNGTSTVSNCAPTLPNSVPKTANGASIVPINGGHTIEHLIEYWASQEPRVNGCSG